MTGAAFPSTARDGAFSGRVSLESAARGSNRRTAVLATGDRALGGALGAELRGLRWQVREVVTAAEVFSLLVAEVPAVCFFDSWFPDLDARECVEQMQELYPEMDLVVLDGAELGAKPARGPLRTEALHALRQAQERLDAPAWQGSLPAGEIIRRHEASREADHKESQGRTEPARSHEAAHLAAEANPSAPLPEFVGSDPHLLEVSRRIQLVARRKTAVLVHGATGTGKELVARALHRLSGRPQDRFVAINCAAIPEALIEAELFGHTRGAFTGAQQSRIGQIEAAAGGTLFLDEVGELPLLAQSKLLRFLESGAIQRVGENQEVRVDVRVVAATHRKLGAMAREGSFRLDLLHRLSVFLIQTPPLAGRTADIDALIARCLENLADGQENKCLDREARAKLHSYDWPGNVRELQHTVERAWILAGSASAISAECVDFGEALF